MAHRIILDTRFPHHEKVEFGFRGGKPLFTIDKYYRVGNSLTWRYYVDSENEVHFFRFDAEGNPHLMPSGDEKHPPVHLGDFIWFEAWGDNTTWAKMTPPRNPARRVFWEAGLPLKKQNVIFGLTDEQVKEKSREYWEERCEDDERIQRQVPNSAWYNFQPVIMASNMCGARLTRDWYHQNWWIAEVFFHKNANLEECAKWLLEKIKEVKARRI